MKRRDFIKGSAGLAGALFPFVGRAQQANPCPPPSIQVGGGSSASAACGSSSAEADWVLRSTSPGVVWAHDFRHPSEFSNFYQDTRTGGEAPTGAPPSIDKIGPTGYSLRYVNPVHGQALGLWARPLSALKSPGNGLPTDDRAAGNVSRLRVWNPSDPAFMNQSNYIGAWRWGWYGHSDYHETYRNPTLAVNGRPTQFTDVWEGNEFYLQFRLRISGSRFDPRNTEGGKLWFIDTAPVSGGDLQQMVGYVGARNQYTYNEQSPEYFRRFDIFTSYGSNVNSFLTDPQGAPQGAKVFPGTDRFTAKYGPPWPPTGSVWAYPSDEWFTILLHVKPGHSTTMATTSNANWLSQVSKDTVLEAWAARAGENSYTLLWSKSDFGWLFGANKGTSGDYSEVLPGFNFFRPTSYCNIPDGANGPEVEYSYWFTQVILSRNPIPCPQDKA